LTESIKNKKHIEQLALANDKRLAQLASVKSGQLLLSESKEDQLEWNEIKDSLTGWARIIYYESATTLKLASQNCSIASMEEGEFTKGEKNGYCRVISAKTGACQLGFYKDNEPHGKWTSYKPDGSLAEPEGLYEGPVVT
jgi:hypothetical protein